MQEGLIHIRRNVTFPDDNQPVIDTLKTESGYRSVPLDVRLRKHFLAQQQHEGFLIGGDSPLSKSAYDKAMKRIRKTIDLHGATAHILRHTYATMLSIAGVDPKTIQYLLGHADISTTMNRYVHASMDKVKQAGQLLCALQSA